MPAAWRANFSFRQLRHSWYMFFFQLPSLPEWWASANDFARMDEMYRTTTVRSRVFSDEDLEAYKKALRQPGALTAAINYYHPNFFPSFVPRRGANPNPPKTRILSPT